MRWVLCLFFMFSGLAKLWSLDGMAATISGSIPLSPAMAIVLGLLVCLAEIFWGLGLIHDSLVRPAGLMLLAMMFSFTAWSVWKYVQGTTADCGCFGELLSRRVDSWLIAENLLTMILLVLIFRTKREVTH